MVQLSCNRALLPACTQGEIYGRRAQHTPSREGGRAEPCPRPSPASRQLPSRERRLSPAPALPTHPPCWHSSAVLGWHRLPPVPSWPSRRPSAFGHFDCSSSRCWSSLTSGEPQMGPHLHFHLYLAFPRSHLSAAGRSCGRCALFCPRLSFLWNDIAAFLGGLRSPHSSGPALWRLLHLTRQKEPPLLSAFHVLRPYLPLAYIRFSSALCWPECLVSPLNSKLSKGKNPTLSHRAHSSAWATVSS